MSENKQPEMLSDDDLDEVTGAGPILAAYKTAKAVASDPVGFASGLASDAKDGMKSKLGDAVGKAADIAKSVGGDLADIADDLNNDGDPSTNATTNSDK
ncbi:MAG: hypothetical protein KDJ55_01635 [Rhodobiaceae bacterium]|nr:hypothetical protein [Rhodobiaceae bacterium]MCC0013574.1 hypothetical protein [Rhodobiaceae bacterium]MCC0018312.1 hypothetical protein [Rhodobiaceae bacterium]MCC0060631.1 hypothetical protein [Rhodobiaceae bacterium]